jgi:hypothetical protein
MSLSGGSASRLDQSALDGEAIEISLGGWEGASQTTKASADSSSSASLLKLATRLRTLEPPIYASEPTSRATGSLEQLLDGQTSASGLGSSGHGRLANGRSLDDGTQEASAVGKKGTPGNSSANGLWEQIEPCWRRLPQKSQVGVTLEITLDNRGRLSSPPQILRPGSARPDEARLVAETKALNAIQACLPFKAPNAFGLKKTYRIDFR